MIHLLNSLQSLSSVSWWDTFICLSFLYHILFLAEWERSTRPLRQKSWYCSLAAKWIKVRWEKRRLGPWCCWVLVMIGWCPWPYGGCCCPCPHPHGARRAILNRRHCASSFFLRGSTGYDRQEATLNIYINMKSCTYLNLQQVEDRVIAVEAMLHQYWNSTSMNQLCHQHCGTYETKAKISRRLFHEPKSVILFYKTMTWCMCSRNL